MKHPTRRAAFVHQFVEFVPEEMKDGVVYVSVQYCTASHMCACGCGNKVVTPITPTDWTLTFDGETISLDPSIGNWSFPCQSHYWIRNNRVQWAEPWKRERIVAGRSYDQRRKQAFFAERDRLKQNDAPQLSDARRGLSSLLCALWRRRK